jgi:3-oxoacyl-[acyl-carrier protein] reductase
MDLGLKGKTALITAASKGIGLGTARVLAREGMRITISSRSAANLEQARRQIAAEGGSNVGGGHSSIIDDILAIEADMTKRDDLERLLATVSNRMGGVDVLVYNAGPPKPGTFAELSYGDWEEATRLLLLSAITLTQGVVPYMKQKGWGRLIYITSLTLRQPIGNLVLSNTVRLAIAGLSKSLSRELGPYGITSNVIIQGYIRTDRTSHLAEELSKKSGATVEAAFKEMAKAVPLGRYGESEEVGWLAAFIASDKGSYLSGATFTVDGGLIASLF